MNPRSLLILTLCLGLIALGLEFSQHLRSTQIQEWNLPDDRSLIPESQLATARGLRLTGGGQTTTLLPDATRRWSIAELEGLRADASRLRSITTFLSEGKLERFIADSESKAEQLGIGSQTLTLLDADGNEIAGLHIGDTAQAGGRFIQRVGESAIYRTGASITVQANPQDWVDKRLFDTALDAIQAVTVTLHGQEAPPVTAYRGSDEGSAFEWQNASDTYRFDANRIESNLRSLLNLRFTRLHRATELADLEALRAVASRYSLQIGSQGPEAVEGEASTVAVSIARLPAPEPEEGEADPATANPPAYLWFDSQSPNEDGQVHGDTSDWVFEISSFSYDNLVRPLLNPAETEAAPMPSEASALPSP